MEKSDIEIQQRDKRGHGEENIGGIKYKKETNPGLRGADGIRALACLAVIIHHASQRIMTQAQSAPVREIQSFLLLGNTGVSIFFVLSGFLLSYPFWKQFLNEGQFPDIRQYVLRRAARIMPGYYASFLVCTLIILLFQIPSEHFWIRLLSGLTFTSGFHYITFFPNEINGPFWSISFEVFCYLLMPVFMYGMFRLFSKKRTFVKALVYWMGVAVFIAFVNKLVHIFLTPDDFQRSWEFGMLGGAKYWMPNYNPVGFFGHFSVGIIASGVTAGLFKSPDAAEKFKKRGGFDSISIAALIGSFLLLWFVRHEQDFTLGFQNQPYYFPVFTVLIGTILAAAPHTNRVGRILDNTFFRYTARISFGLYVWHYVVMYVTGNVIVKNYKAWTMTDLLPWALTSLAVIAASYLIAAMSFRFIEKPVMDRVHKKIHP
jgi:peptidoglycan/LPS O-acetylase OafA/YrhL